MEEKTTNTTAASEAPSVSAPHKKDPFSIIGKIVIGLVITAVLVGGGIYLGMTLKMGGKEEELLMVKTSPTPQAGVPTQTVSTPSAQPTTTQEVKTITAGGTAGSAFGVFAIDIPSGWTYTTDKNEVTSTITLTKNGHEIKIYQAAMGGGGCLYPGSPPSEMAQIYTDYVEVQGAHDMLRRSWNKVGNPAGSITYTVCQKSSAENSYGMPTAFGAISIKAPVPSDANIMKEVDFMLSSLAQK